MWQKCKRPSRRLRDSWRGFVCKTRVYEGRVFFAMKLSPKVFNTFRRFQPFSPIFHVHRCLKKISMFDALFTFVEITSYCWYVLAWKKTLLGKGGKNVGTLRSWITELQTPGCRIPTATDFGPKCCALECGFDGFDGFGAPRWKDRNPWKIGKSANHVVEDFETSNTSEVVSAQSSRDVVALRSAVMRASRAGAHGRNRSSGPPKSPLQRDFPWFDEPKEPSV